jgi:tetratricopeptide (TPR) repeat protein
MAKARRFLADGEPAEARLEVLSLDDDEARAIVLEAENALALMNIEAAVQWCRAGDSGRVQHHLELASDFHRGGHEEAFREARREMREMRAVKSAEAAERKAAQDAVQLSIGAGALNGGSAFPDGAIPDELHGPEREELEARLALLLDGYPAELRPHFEPLGAPFARAVLDLDEGQADQSLLTLLNLPDDNPLVRWERARAAHALGDPAAAVKELRAFAELALGHYAIGNHHTGVMLAQLTAETGDLSGALRVIRSVRKVDRGVGPVLFAQLLEVNNELEEAEQVLTRLIKAHPRQTALYSILARVRVRAGHKDHAMRALEAAMEVNCCTPGQCGYTPPDPGILRSLSILYLEEGIEQERALELADQARDLVQKPGWEDHYLQALVAHATKAPDAPAMASALFARTRDERLRGRLQTHLSIA